MTRPDYVPSDAENIEDYGAVEGTDTVSAAEDNTQAIIDAAKASSGENVYIPAGTYYIGDGSSAQFLLFGSSSVDRGPAGTSVYGKDPTKSFLVYASGAESDGGIQIRYSSDSSHGDVTWRGLTWDGNTYNVPFTTSDNQRGFVIKGSGDYTWRNVRLRKFYGAATFLSKGNNTYTYKRCTVHDIGIEKLNETAAAGDGVLAHAIAGQWADSTLTVDDCEFTLIAGSVIDFDGNSGTSGSATNNWVSGTGASFTKVNDAGTFDISKLYYQCQSQALLDALNSDAESQDYNGRCFLYRLEAPNGTVPTFTLNDVQIEDCPFEAIIIHDEVGSGDAIDVDIAGGGTGPIAIDNSAFDADLANSALKDISPSTLTFDNFGDLSVHNTSGDVFDMANGAGSISHLKRDGNNSLGTTGSISISTDETNASPFSPTVPSQSDVGINSGSDNSSSDSSPSVSWVSPTSSETVSGTVTVQIDASDSEDSDDSLDVTYNIDGGSSRSTTYNDTSGYYEDSWDTTTDTDGEHSIEAQVTDSAGNTSSAAIDVIVGEIFEDWTPQWESTYDDWGVVSGSGFDGENALAFEHDGTDRTRYAISWDSVGTPADVETLDKFRVPDFTDDSNLGFHARVHLRSATQNGNEDGYWIEIEDPEDAFRLAKYTDGNMTTLKRFGTPVENTWFYRRFRIEGTALKAKTWQTDESEPADWDVEISDSDHADGWVGIGSFDTGLVETDVFSVGTGGASAPGPDSSPSVSWATPTDGETVSGTVTVQIDASDSEDSDDSLAVDYRIDGNSWRTASYNSNTGYYEDSWDTTTVADGSHTMEARATDSAGNTSSTTITVTTDNSGSAPTVDSLSLSEAETSDSDAEFDADWQVSDSDGDLGSVDLVLTQDSNGSTEDSASISVSGDTASGTTRLVASGDDGSGNSYTVELTVTDSGGNTASETSSTSETEDSSVPTIDRFSVSEAGRPDPHADITVVWDVSDTDGDLATVDIDIADSSGTVQSVTWTVSGATASDTDSFKIKDGDGKTFDVTLTVADAAGHSTSKTKSVTA